jgi:shikimate dehydrogenase
MIRAAVIGHPINHSKSPRIHGYWLKNFGITGVYTAIDIAPENLARDIQQLNDDGYAGFNVTLPHKIKMLDLCDDVDAVARAIGAVNTVIIRNGKFYGTNTDGFGFMENLRATIPDWNATTCRVAILGAGGAARAVVYSLQQAGVADIMVMNRTPEHAEELRRLAPNLEIVPWHDRHDILADADLVVNTTSLGMIGKPELDLDLRALTPSSIVYDLVYAPLMTPLLLNAQQRGNRIVTGIGMLLHQARPGFEGWFGHVPIVTPELEQLVLA